MGGSSGDARFAVFDFEEDLFLEPFDLFYEANIGLLGATAQQNQLLQEESASAVASIACTEREVSLGEAVAAPASTNTEREVSLGEAVAAPASTNAETARSLLPSDEPSLHGSLGASASDGRAPQIVEKLRDCAQVATSMVEQLQQDVLHVTRVHSIMKKTKRQEIFCLKDRDTVRGGTSLSKKPRLFDAARTEAVRRKKMSDLMRLAGNILRQLMQHRWAWPFLQPVDVEGLQLHDYYKIIRRPMDLGKIRSRLEAKDGTRYRHVQELCEDVRLVFRNAMLYNESWTEVHRMAKVLLQRFEDRWKASIEPQLLEDEKLNIDEPEGYLLDIAELQSEEEQAVAELCKGVVSRLNNMESKLNSLVKQVLSKGRPMRVEEKADLYSRLQKLPPASFSRVVELVCPENFAEAATQDLSVDLEALDSITLWRLHFFERMLASNVREQRESKSELDGKK